MVRIPGFHPGDPGSSPGVGTFCRFIFLTFFSNHATKTLATVVTTSLIRLAVRTPRCGRGNPGSNPGLDISCCFVDSSIARTNQDRHPQNASAGNRTRVTSMATTYSTTRPLMQMPAAWCVMHIPPLHAKEIPGSRRCDSLANRTRMRHPQGSCPQYYCPLSPLLARGNQQKRSWADLNRHRWIQSPEC